MQQMSSEERESPQNEVQILKVGTECIVSLLAIVILEVMVVVLKIFEVTQV